MHVIIAKECELKIQVKQTQLLRTIEKQIWAKFKEPEFKTVRVGAFILARFQESEVYLGLLSPGTQLNRHDLILLAMELPPTVPTKFKSKNHR